MEIPIGLFQVLCLSFILLHLLFRKFWWSLKLRNLKRRELGIKSIEEEVEKLGSFGHNSLLRPGFTSSRSALAMDRIDRRGNFIGCGVYAN
jgi:hypothetical protein